MTLSEEILDGIHNKILKDKTEFHDFTKDGDFIESGLYLINEDKSYEAILPRSSKIKKWNKEKWEKEFDYPRSIFTIKYPFNEYIFNNTQNQKKIIIRGYQDECVYTSNNQRSLFCQSLKSNFIDGILKHEFTDSLFRYNGKMSEESTKKWYLIALTGLVIISVLSLIVR